MILSPLVDNWVKNDLRKTLNDDAFNALYPEIEEKEDEIMKFNYETDPWEEYAKLYEKPNIYDPNIAITYNFDYLPGTVKFTGWDFKEPEYLLVLEDYGNVKQGSVVELVKKNSHYSLCVTTEGELWIRNEVLDPYFVPGEEVWVDIVKWDGKFHYHLGKFIHHDGPHMGFVNVDGRIEEVFLDQLSRCNLKD